MDIFPAIDLMNGQAVRLRQGDYAEKTVYDADPLRRARAFYDAGARYLHAVDLDGARSGRTDNFDTVQRLAKESGLRVEIGGGIRSLETAERYREAGVWRVILGTAAAEDPELLRRCVESFGTGVAVGVDVRDGMVMTRGWLEGGTLSCEAFCGRLAELGVDTVICTDISRDGMLAGVNAALYAELIARFPSLRFVASGGVSRLEDVVRLREMGLSGAIIGKALYTGAVDLREAVLAGEGETA
jgi:phosphoribosylformimino-5-aminoimidazole carboxamide ribotide isomerase